MGADIKLTEAVILLQKARDLVADFIDSKQIKMERLKIVGDMLVKDPNGSLVLFSEVEGTEQEIKDWMRKFATHASFPDCQIRKTGECTCGLKKFITKQI